MNSDKKYILSLDQGTTSSRAILFDKQGQIKSKAQYEFTQIYPKPGWVEHDPMEILRSEYRAVADALIEGGVEAKEIAAIGVKPQFSGIKLQVSLFIMLSYGSAAEQLIWQKESLIIKNSVTI